MKTFQELKSMILESTNTGNYVSIDVISKIPDMKLEPLFGGSHVCDPKDQHATLIYSETTKIPKSIIQKFLNTQPTEVLAKTVKAVAFDNPPKDGQRDESLCTIVLKLESPDLVNIHNGLVKLGLKHSYEEFSPHVSLLYSLPIEKKEQALKTINGYLSKMNGLTIKFSGYHNETINKNWHEEKVSERE